MSPTSPPAFELAVSPRGHAYLRAAPEVDAWPAKRVQAAFAQSEGAGLLQLGAELKTHLPPGLYWARSLARAFLTRLCAVAELECLRAQAQVDPGNTDFLELAQSVPPLLGAEYVGEERLQDWWQQMQAAFRASIASFEGSVEEWLKQHGDVWHLVGRVCFHLAENKRDPERPFAFLATYTTGVSGSARLQHLPLARALKQLAGPLTEVAAGGSGDAGLLKLLLPVSRAAKTSGLVAGLLESGGLYHPLAWDAGQAYEFLQEIPVLEAAGVVVRMPNWWKAGRRARPQLRVTLGEAPAVGVGAEALLDFRLEAVLAGEMLTAEELEELCRGAAGLRLIKGQWVEVDPERLGSVLEHWHAVEGGLEDGLGFSEAMRRLSGTRLGSGSEVENEQAEQGWLGVQAGAWLQGVLGDLRSPAADAALDAIAGLKAELRPYQKRGVAWLRLLERLGLGGCLADDMGLGKTVQVLALLQLLKNRGGQRRQLLVAPASLLGNWMEEAARFTPELRVFLAHSSGQPAARLKSIKLKDLADVDLVLTSYGSVRNLAWLKRLNWDLVVLDEAQAIKTPNTRQTRAVKKLRSRCRFALTGTPVENRLADLWSLYDFLCPGLLGGAKAFKQLVKRLAERPAETRYRPLRSLIQPYLLRRRKTDRALLPDLPDKLEMTSFCSLSPRQAALYRQVVADLTQRLSAVDGTQRRGVVLSALMQMKQICNHPAQYLGEADFLPEQSGKLQRLLELAATIAARQEKLLVFSQFRELTGVLAERLAEVFGRPGLVLHGGTPVKQRQGLVRRFQAEQGPPFFVLSLKAGGTGLNLTAASHVIHFDRWWNPAVESQASDRAYRIGQTRNVVVHRLICRGTVEEKIDALIESKRELVGQLVEGPGPAALTELNDQELLALLALDVQSVGAGN